MIQFKHKIVRYIGKTNEEFGVVHGKEYVTTHTYGQNVGIRLTDTKRSSIPAKYFEIVKSLIVNNGVDVHSILVLDGKPLGVRFIHEDGSLYDVGLSSLKGVDESLLRGFKIEHLQEFGNLVKTAEEHNYNLNVEDMSGNKDFCANAVKLFLGY